MDRGGACRSVGMCNIIVRRLDSMWVALIAVPLGNVPLVCNYRMLLMANAYKVMSANEVPHPIPELKCSAFSPTDEIQLDHGGQHTSAPLEPQVPIISNSTHFSPTQA